MTRPTPSPFTHAFAAVWIAAMLVAAHWWPDRYEAWMQEDRPIEWWTACLFLLAGAIRLRTAVRDRRAFDFLVGLFCIFVAGEEISWGQRLLGFTPPAVFLEHNHQQELTLHNFTSLVDRPKWLLIAALAGYGLLLPALARWPRAARVLDRIGSTAPAPGYALWFAAAAALLIWYPASFTGEWVELLAGLLFFDAPLTGRASVAGIAVALATALMLAALGARRAGDPALIRCAGAEAEALSRDITGGAAAGPRLHDRRIHKRIWTADADGYIRLTEAASYGAVACEGRGGRGSHERRARGIDPWGTSYWVRTLRDSSVVVYSFGPDRRRDAGNPERVVNDIVARSR